MENGRRRKRRHKGPRDIPWTPPTDPPGTEHIPLIEKIDHNMAWWEDERLRNMHLAAMRTTFWIFWFWDRNPHYAEEGPEESWNDKHRLAYLSNSLRCNVMLNAYCTRRNKITKLHASEAVTLLSLKFPVFRQKELKGVLCLIYKFASMPWYPDTGREQTVEELFPEVGPIEKDLGEQILRHYELVLPGVKF